jgi:Protein of unknown function (DUF2750)
VSQSASQAAAFYSEVAANRSVWTIRDDAGFPAPATNAGQRAQPFWSSRHRAERVIASVPAYVAFRVVQIAWEDFRSRWAPALKRDRILVGVNWSGERVTGYDLDPEDVVRNVESVARESR